MLKSPRVFPEIGMRMRVRAQLYQTRLRHFAALRCCQRAPSCFRNMCCARLLPVVKGERRVAIQITRGQENCGWDLETFENGPCRKVHVLVPIIECHREGSMREILTT